MSWRQVLVTLICTSLTVRSSPCSWVEVLSSWSQGYKAVVKLQMEETVDHWDVDVEFSEPVINFEAWKGHVNKISDTSYTVSNTCYNNMVYSCQCFELPYLVRHEPMWEGNTTFKFNGELVPTCEPPSCDDTLSGAANTSSTFPPTESLTTSELTENLNVVGNILNDLSSLRLKRYKRQSNGFTKDENELLDTLGEYTTYLKNECSTKSGSCQSKTLAAYGSKLNSIFEKVKNSGGISSGFVDAFKGKYEQLKEATKTAVDTQAENSCKANGKPCIFPFKDDAGKEHNTCADYKGRYFWCATRVNSKGKYVSWERCPDDGRCPLPPNEKKTTTTTTTTTTTPPPPTKQPQQGVACMAGSKPCVFPFKDTDGTEYNECADYKGRYFWCATAVNSKGTFTNWGKCTECEDPNTTPSTPEDCRCTDYINKKGYGDCQKGHPDFSNAEICYVKLPSTCSDLRESKTDPGKMASAEACKKDCSCTDYINKKGYGQCKKGHPDFNDAGICYVKLPSTCSDLKESKTDPGKMASAEACKKVDGDDSCCQELDIASTGGALEHQGARLGSYKKQAKENDGKPVYLQEGAGGNYLFYRETFGWLISRQGPQSTSKGGIMSDSEADCPTDGGMKWKIYDRVTYDNLDSTFKLKCKGSDTTVSNYPTKPQGSCLANGKPCIFPFKDDDGTSYNGCPKYEDRYYWCATSLKTNGVYKVWEHCPEDGSCRLLPNDDSSTPAALPKLTTKPRESKETTPSVKWEPGTTSFYINDGNNNYECEISFEFNANKKIEFKAILSTCSESKKQEDVMQYVGKHNFSLISKEGATLECFVGAAIARGDLCQTVLEDSLHCDSKSDSSECREASEYDCPKEHIFVKGGFSNIPHDSMLLDVDTQDAETKCDCRQHCHNHKDRCVALLFNTCNESNQPKCILLNKDEPEDKDQFIKHYAFCKRVQQYNLQSTGGANAMYPQLMGIYKLSEEVTNNFPIYKQVGGSGVAYVEPTGNWAVVENKYLSMGKAQLYSASRPLLKTLPDDQWYYDDGATWIKDSSLTTFLAESDLWPFETKSVLRINPEPQECPDAYPVESGLISSNNPAFHSISVDTLERCTLICQAIGKRCLGFYYEILESTCNKEGVENVCVVIVDGQEVLPSHSVYGSKLKKTDEKFQLGKRWLTCTKDDAYILYVNIFFGFYEPRVDTADKDKAHRLKLISEASKAPATKNDIMKVTINEKIEEVLCQQDHIISSSDILDRLHYYVKSIKHDKDKLTELKRLMTIYITKNYKLFLIYEKTLKKIWISGGLQVSKMSEEEKISVVVLKTLVMNVDNIFYMPQEQQKRCIRKDPESKNNFDEDLFNGLRDGRKKELLRKAYNQLLYYKMFSILIHKQGEKATLQKKIKDLKGNPDFQLEYNKAVTKMDLINQFEKHINNNKGLVSILNQLTSLSAANEAKYMNGFLAFLVAFTEMSEEETITGSEFFGNPTITTEMSEDQCKYVINVGQERDNYLLTILFHTLLTEGYVIFGDPE